jgi:Uma2 family endonuclease
MEHLMSTKAQKLTFEAYLALPEMKQRYEIVDGVLIMPPAPTPAHQWFLQRIFLRLHNFVEARHLGVVLFAPVDLLIQREPLRTRQPDILYLSAERTGVRGLSELQGLQFFEIPPDLVVEVLSPSNTRRDLEGKLEDYRKVGVLECWLVSPEAETIEVLSFLAEGTRVIDVFSIDGSLQSPVLPEFTLDLREVFR